MKLSCNKSIIQYVFQNAIKPREFTKIGLTRYKVILPVEQKMSYTAKHNFLVEKCIDFQFILAAQNKQNECLLYYCSFN